MTSKEIPTVSAVSRRRRSSTRLRLICRIMRRGMRRCRCIPMHGKNEWWYIGVMTQVRSVLRLCQLP
jgi:hypothetical protein